MKELSTKDPRSQDRTEEGRQMSLLQSFSVLLGSSPTLGEKRRARSEKVTSQRTSW